MGVLDGLAVVVTGAGGGLGRPYALAIAAAGAAVVVGDIDGEGATRTVREITASNAHAVAVTGSVTDPEYAQRLVTTSIEQFGSIDGLVNNAGVLNPGVAWEQPAEVVAQSLEVNVAGVIHCGTAALRAMVDAGAGSIVNVVSGAMQGMPRLSLYGATKGAVMGLTYGWAVESAGTGVRVNAISPLARTGMSELMGLDDAVKGPAPEKIAPAVVHLLSPAAAETTGQILRFDGRRLEVVTSPHPVVRTRSREWDTAAVAAALDGPLRRWIVPAGLDVEPVPSVVDAGGCPQPT